MAEPSERSHRNIVALIEAGILAGLIGGALMLAFLVARAAIGGAGWWSPLQSVAAAVYGPEAVYGGSRTIAVGAGLHFALSIGWGVVYAAIVRRTLTPAVSMFVGAVFGAGVWFITAFLVLPAINPLLQEQFGADPLMFFVAHIVYGVGVSASPMIARALSRRQHRVRAEVY